MTRKHVRNLHGRKIFDEWALPEIDRGGRGRTGRFSLFTTPNPGKCLAKEIRGIFANRCVFWERQKTLLLTEVNVSSRESEYPAVSTELDLCGAIGRDARRWRKACTAVFCRMSTELFSEEMRFRKDYRAWGGRRERGEAPYSQKWKTKLENLGERRGG